MNLLSVNYRSVAVAGLLGLATEMLWYAPAVFGTIWAGHIYPDPESVGFRTTAGFFNSGIVIMLFLNLALATVVAVFAKALNYRGFNGAVVLSLWLGLGVIGVMMLGGYGFVVPSWTVVALDTGYDYLRILIFCLIVCMWPARKASQASSASSIETKRTMKLSSINYWSVLAAALTTYALGFVWTNPLLFGAVREVFLSPIPNFAILMVTWPIACIVLALVAAIFANALGYRGVGGAVTLSLWLGGGIVFLHLVNNYWFLPYGTNATLSDLLYLFLRMLIPCFFACLWPGKLTQPVKP